MPEHEKRSEGPLVPLIIGVALLMQALNQTIIAAALPAMAQAFGEPVLNLNLAITAYMVGAAVFLPLSGWVAERFGTRTTMLTAIGVFVGASVLCGLCQSIEQLTAARTLQGFAGALLMPVGRLVLLRTTPKHELVRALSYLAVPMLVGPAAGPPLGGFIVSTLSWPWIFFLNVPFGILGAFLVMRYVAEVKEESERFDWPGFVLSGVALAAIVYGVESLGSGLFPQWLVHALIGTGLLAAGVYLFYARRARHPILEMRLLKSQTFAAATLGGFFTRLKIGATPFLLAILFQVGFGMSPLAAGWLIFASAVGAFMMRTTATHVFTPLGFRRVLIVNGVLESATFMMIAFFRPDTPVWAMAALLVVHGYLRALQLTGLNALAYADLEDRQMASASTFSGVVQMLAQAVGVGGSAAVLHATQAGAAHLTAAHIYPAFLIVGGLGMSSLLWHWRLPAEAGASLRGRR